MYYYKLNVNTYLYPFCTNQTQWGGVGTRDIHEVKIVILKMFYYIFYKLHAVIPAFDIFPIAKDRTPPPKHHSMPSYKDAINIGELFMWELILLIAILDMKVASLNFRK